MDEWNVKSTGTDSITQVSDCVNAKPTASCASYWNPSHNA